MTDVVCSPGGAESSTLIGRDPRDTGLSLVGIHNVADAKVFAITTHLKASKISPTKGILCLLPYAIKTQQKAQNGVFYLP